MITKNIRGTLHNDPDHIVEFTLKLPPVGKGGNAWVYRAHANDGTAGTNDNYMVKILRPSIRGIEFDENEHISFSLSCDQYGTPLKEIFHRRVEMMLAEADMMHTFQSEAICMNISAVFDCGDTVAVAMPISSGCVLSEIPVRPLSDSNEVLKIICDTLQISERIRILHTHSKLHMDISPDNIFLQKDGAVRLLDFGSICNVGTPVICYSRKTGFSAPETESIRTLGISKKSFGYEADIFSIGAVMYYLLFGRTFNRSAPAAYYFDEINTLPVNQGSKEQLRYIFKKTLAFTPSLRCSDIKDLISDLNELISLIRGFGVSSMRLYQKSIEARCKVSDGMFIRNTTVDESIIPIEPVSDNKIPQLLSSVDNILICGESGSGKTALIMYLWDKMLDRKKNGISSPIPLYINLSNYTEGHFHSSGDPVESFILRQLCISCYGAADLSCCSPDVLSGILQEFCKDSDYPEYCLLLDGLDEVFPEKRSFIIDELERFSRFSNIRLIVTSRYCDEHLENFRKCNFTYLSDSCITQYLKSHDFGSKEIREITKNRTLMSLLRYPLYLCLVCRMKETDCRVSDISRSGQLLDRYFLSDNVGDESEIRRWKRVSSGRETSVLNTIDFCLRHLLPCIAFHMEYGETRFSLSRTNFNDILFSLLNEENGWFSSSEFLTCFPELADTVPYIDSCDSLPKKLKTANQLLRIICTALCLMTEQNGTVSFVNQTVKRYMAALHICNAIHIASACSSTEALRKIGKKRWNRDTLHMAGDILCNRVSNTDSVISVLDLLRRNPANEYAGLTSNLIALLIARDGNLDNRDLSDLDLSACELSETSCKGTLFNGSNLSDRSLIGIGRNTFAYAVTPDADKIFLLDGSRSVSVVDSSDNALSEISAETHCDMCISAQICSDRLYTLGRSEGRLTLCTEVFDADGILINRLPIDARNVNTSRQYQDIIARFSPDGEWLALTCSPAYYEFPGELLIVNCITGSLHSIAPPENIHALRFCGNKLHAITADRQNISYHMGDFAPIEKDNVPVYDRLEDMLLTQNEDGIVLSVGSELRKLNFANRITDLPSTRFQLCGKQQSPACLITPKKEGISYLAYFDDTPPRTVRADDIVMCTDKTALISKTENTSYGTHQYVGLYDVVRENWIVCSERHRGMLQGAVIGSSLLMTRGNNAVLCDISSGRFTTLEIPEAVSGVWISDKNRIMYEYSDVNGIGLVSDGTSAFISKAQCGTGKKGSLSILNMSPGSDKALLLSMDKQQASVFLFEPSSERITPIPLPFSSIGKSQGHILTDGRVAILSDMHKDGKKRTVLQVTGIDINSTYADVTEFKLPSAKLLLLSDGTDLYLVSFELSGKDEPWEYGNAAVTQVYCSNEQINFGETRRYPCCCLSNPRIDCRYTQSPWLVMKKRFTGSEYSLLNICTGETKTLYIDNLQFNDSSFSRCTGISKETQAILKNAGAKLE